MSDSVTYKNNTPTFIVLHGKVGKFNKTSCGAGRFAYAATIDIECDEYVAVHDAATNVVVFRGDEVYGRYRTAARQGLQDLEE